MNTDQIRMMLTKIVSDLSYIERSQAFQEAANLPNAGELELMTVTALDMAIALKLKFSQTLDTQLDKELDDLFKGAAS